jgi:hypothetical protein
VLEDLINFTTNNQYNQNTFEDTAPTRGKGIEKLKGNKLSLFGVFDGHMGSVAAEYAKTRLPYELVAREEFAAGDYSTALKKAFEAVHKALIQSGAYHPDVPRHDFGPGTTASVALIAQDDVYFASLGNSPVIVMRKEEANLPNVVFSGQAAEDLERLRKSGVFLMNNYHPRSGARREKAWKALEEKKIYRHGFSNLPLFGSIGDSIYEPDNYNALVESLSSFVSKKEPMTHSNFARHIAAQEKWKQLQKHVYLAQRRLDQSWVLNGMCEGRFDVPPTIEQSPLSRVPNVQKFAAKDLLWFVIASDGVLNTKYEQDEGAMQSIKVLMDHYFEKDAAHMPIVFGRWNYGEFDDDLSAVMVNLQSR